MRKKLKWEWESLDENTFRAKVVNGWLVKTGKGDSFGLIFVTDIYHEWEIITPALAVESEKVEWEK